MESYQLEYIGARADAKKSLVYTSIWLLSLLILAFIIKFDARPDQLVDTPPLRSDEVIEEFQIDNVELEGIDYNDAPDFCDAYIASCDIDGIPATEEELEIINADGQFVYDQVEKHIY